MVSTFQEIPQRIFLDSSALQTLQSYGSFIYESEPLKQADPIHRNPSGPAFLTGGIAPTVRLRS